MITNYANHEKETPQPTKDIGVALRRQGLSSDKQGIRDAKHFQPDKLARAFEARPLNPKDGLKPIAARDGAMASIIFGRIPMTLHNPYDIALRKGVWHC